jgi:pimeloyl-ACP methyl ester carboxylesterase
MNKSVVFALSASVAALLAAPQAAHAQQGKSAMTAEAKTANAPSKSGHLAINGLNYYYEIHGAGEPLLLLHGGLGSIGMFGPVLPMLAKGRQVIGVDLQGHGRTALGDRPLSIEALGDDMAALVKELGYGQLDVMGYSFGGGVAFRMAVQHPEAVRRLAIVSAGFAHDGYYPEILAAQATVGEGLAEMMKPTPMYQSYAAIAPKVEDFPKLLNAIGALMAKTYDWSADVKGLKMPVMLVYGDSDMFRPEHIMKFYQLLGGGLKDAGWMRETMSRNRLAILPDLTHYELFTAPALAETVLPFLNGKSGARSWAEQVAR